MRPDVMAVAEEARGRGLAVTLPTNGTLIGATRARRIADAASGTSASASTARGRARVLRHERRDPTSAERIRARLARNDGARNASGRGFAAVDWDLDRPRELLTRLRTRSERLTGRCASCRYLQTCGGGLASRSLAAGRGLDGSDPGCHLTDAEVAVAA